MRWSGLVLSVGLAACAGAACRHGGAPGLVAVAPPPAPDELAAACAHLDAPATALDSHKQLELLSEVNEPHRQQAEFSLGLAYTCLGLHAEALAVFDPTTPGATTGDPLGALIDQARAQADGKGAATTRTAPPQTLRLLVSLYRRFPHWRGAENAVAAFSPASFDAPALADIRADLLYMAGRAAYSAGQYPRALELFGRIPAASALHVRATLLQGAVHVRNFAAKPAVDAFAEALRATTSPRGSEDGVRFRDLANLSLARTYYSTGQLELAARYYAAVPSASVYGRERLFEVAWTEYRLQDHAAAVRDVSALRSNASSIPPDVMAEATLLQSEAALALGDTQLAAASLDRFNAVYPALLTQLKTFLAANPDDGALYARLAALRRGKSDLSADLRPDLRPDPAPSLEPVLRDLLASPWLARAFDDVDELTREITAHERLPEGWRATELAQAVSRDLTARLSAAIQEAGLRGRGRIKRITDELAQQIKRTIHIEYEML